MFRGNHPTRVDEKGRLKLPAEFKRRVDEVYGPLFYITSMDGKRAQVYPLKEWEAIESSLQKMSPMDPIRRKFQDVTNFYGQMAEMDAQGLLEVVNSEVFTSMMTKATGAVELTDEDLSTFAGKTNAT